MGPSSCRRALAAAARAAARLAGSDKGGVTAPTAGLPAAAAARASSGRAASTSAATAVLSPWRQSLPRLARGMAASASRRPAAAAAAAAAGPAPATAPAAETDAAASPPMPSAVPCGPGIYRVEVVTGDVRGAETTAAAAVRLVGEHGRSEEFVLGNDQDEYGFERGSRQAYELAIPISLGRLLRVEVAQVPPSADQAGGAAAADRGGGTGWFLDRVCVTPPRPAGPDGGPAPTPITFPCSAWLGSNDEYESRQAAVMARELVPEGACAPTDGKAAAAAAAGTWREPATARRPPGGRPTTGPLPLSAAGAAPHRSRPVPAPGPALAFDLGAVALPHPDKVKKDGPAARGVCRAAAGWAGEDAYFTAVGPPLPLPPGVPGLGGGASADASSTLVRRLVALGVSDGVYAWRAAGIDAGAFSRALMAAAAAEVAAGAADPASVLAGAEASVRSAGVMGSATACVVLLDPARGALTAANVGDSGFAVAGRASAYGLTNSLTGGEISLAYNSGNAGSGAPPSSRVIKFKSPQQEHEFGRPYQLGHHAAADCAGDAMLATLPVSPGDVVVLGSDGLWDNLGDDGLLAALDGHSTAGGGRWNRAPEPPAALARRLAALAFAGSVDKKGMTPYSAAASAAFNMIYSGGKADDITVVVARVRERRAGEP